MGGEGGGGVCGGGGGGGSYAGEYGGCDKTVTFSDFRNCFTMSDYHAVDKQVEILSLDIFSDNIS